MGRKVCFQSEEGQYAICINDTENCVGCEDKPTGIYPFMAWSKPKGFKPCKHAREGGFVWMSDIHCRLNQEYCRAIICGCPDYEAKE